MLLTYAQRWTPTTYQVGDLIKSIPLAPKETRRYSKKIVIKEKRDRKRSVEPDKPAQRDPVHLTRRHLHRAEGDAEDQLQRHGEWHFPDRCRRRARRQHHGCRLPERLLGVEEEFPRVRGQAACEYRDELKVELETETSFESEFQESGEITNPNDELTVTYLFYELQRRYLVAERLRRLTSVVLVAQEMPHRRTLTRTG